MSTKRPSIINIGPITTRNLLAIQEKNNTKPTELIPDLAKVKGFNLSDKTLQLSNPMKKLSSPGISVPD
jgi:hypothetical protein